MTLFDEYGRPFEASSQVTDPLLNGGWVLNGGDLNKPKTWAANQTYRTINRSLERLAARLGYLTNPMIFGAVNILASFALGDSLTYGKLADDRANAAWSEFWEANKLHEMAERFFIERMTDGESLTIFPQNSRRLRRNRDQPARIGFYDIEQGFEYETVPGLPTELEQVILNDNTILEPNEFLFHAHLGGLWNDPRGYPVLMPVTNAASAYAEFLNDRLKVNRLQTRINGVYKTFVNKGISGEALTSLLLQRKDAFGQIPKTGGVVVLAKNAETNESEEFELFTPQSNAKDATEDGRLLRMYFSTGLNLPLIWQSDGEDSSYATSTNQKSAGVVALAKYQKPPRQWLIDIGRLELKRRYGENQTYKTETLSLKGGRTVKETNYVRADMLELPVSMPEPAEDDLETVKNIVEFTSNKGWLSDQTGAGMLGIDLLQELELKASEPDKPEPTPQPVPPNQGQP